MKKLLVFIPLLILLLLASVGFRAEPQALSKPSQVYQQDLQTWLADLDRLDHSLAQLEIQCRLDDEGRLGDEGNLNDEGRLAKLGDKYDPAHQDNKREPAQWGNNPGLAQQGDKRGLTKLRNEAALEKAREDYQQSRRSFKRIEFLLAYLDPEGVKDYINGAPLPHLERKAPDMVILEPKGYQVLDEVLYAEEALESATELHHLSQDLKLKANRLAETHRNLGSSQVFHAVRKGLVSLFTLGVSGFDTPSSGLALEDAKWSLEGMQDYLHLYLGPLGNEPTAQVEKIDRPSSPDPLKPEKPELVNEIDHRFDLGQSLLSQAPDFDQFDRLGFLQQVINPLYALTLEAQQTLGVELPSEVNPLPSPINYQADNLFAPDFLNPWFFSKLHSSPQNDQRTALGRLLFFDPVLSSDGGMSCATCHHPEKAFAESLPKSKASGGEGDVGRNSMSLVNAVYATRYFHDLRSEHLRSQVAHVVFNEKEFNTSFKVIIAKLSASPTYKRLFAEAFPEMARQTVNEYSVTSALAYYVQSLTAFNSPFDQYVRGERDDLSPSAHRGFNLFMGKAACGTCHFPPTFAGLLPPGFADSESEVLGVQLAHDTLYPVLDPDEGRYVNGRPKERAPFYRYGFKTPSVRNIDLTAPYMHNGAYADLESVVDFYNRGGGLGMGLDLPHQTLPGDPLELDTQDKEDLIAFMRTLTDTSGITARPAELPALDDGKARPVKYFP